MPPKSGKAAGEQQSPLSAEDLEQLEAFAQAVVKVTDESTLLQAVAGFNPVFFMLDPATQDGRRLHSSLQAMSYAMSGLPLGDDTLDKCDRLFVGRVDILPRCIMAWRRRRDAEDAVAPAAAAAGANTPKLSKVELALAAAASAGLLAQNFTEGKLKETAKRLESTGAPSFSQRAAVRFASGNWTSEPKTPGLPGAKEHGFFRAAWHDARHEHPSLDPVNTLLVVWSATVHFMTEVCREDLAGDLAHVMWLTETKLLHPLMALGVVPERMVDLVEKHCFEPLAVVLARHKDATPSEELPTFSEAIDIDPMVMEGEVTRQARDGRRASAHGGSHGDAEFAIMQAASGLMLPFSIPPATATVLRQDNVCPLDLVAPGFCPMGHGCGIGHFDRAADREAAVLDPRYGLTAAIRTLRGRIHAVGRDMAPGDVFSAAPRARAPSPRAANGPKKGGSYAAAASHGSKRTPGPKRG